METHPVSRLADYLAAQQRVWVRVGANRLNGAWQLSLLEITVDGAPPSWRRGRWSYERAVFVAATPAGATVSRWLERGRISLPSLSIKMTLDDSLSVERRDSNFQGIYEQLPWPTREWTVHFHGNSGQTLHDELVAADAPAFIRFDQAAAAFFGVSLKPNRNFSGREIVVRQQDRRARIDRVQVHPTELVVEISGAQLRGASLTLSGLNGASQSLSPHTREVRLPIPEGLGEGAWLALHRDRELLDRRILDRALGAQDVDVVVDSATRIGVLISGGERATVEFKRQLPGKDPTVVMKTVAAFANGAGGTILFGVENNGEIVGVGDDRGSEGRDRLTSLVSDWIRPLPNFECEWVEVAGCGVLALSVEPGEHVPYGVGTSDRGVRYYIRRAGTTFPASPADVRAFVQSRTTATPELYFPRRGR
jgi:hypothetical protein